MSDVNETSDDNSEKGPSPARLSGKFRWVKYLVVLVVLGLFAGLAVMGVANARYAARRVEFSENLRQFGLAATNFHGTYGYFPPLIADGSEYREVTQPLSFHASMIPYVEASDIFIRIDKTIPWNAPANRDVYEVIWLWFLSPFHEVEKSPDGYGATLIVSNSRLMPEGVGIAKDKITDGTANTILAGGIDIAAVPAWGDPENDRDPANGFAGGPEAFGGLPKGSTQVLFADGHVKSISKNTELEVAKALATPAGGETITPSDIRP